MRWFPWVLSAILALVIAAMAWMLVLRGQVREGDDGRVSILLSSGERNLVLAEMRGFLESVQEIVEAVPRGDLKAAEAAARRVGRINLDDLPASLLRKLPGEVKRLGLDTHRKFYKLAGDIRQGMKREEILPRLAGIMVNCTGCHAGYRLDVERGAR